MIFRRLKYVRLVGAEVLSDRSGAKSVLIKVVLPDGGEDRRWLPISEMVEKSDGIYFPAWLVNKVKPTAGVLGGFGFQTDSGMYGG